MHVSGRHTLTPEQIQLCDSMDKLWVMCVAIILLNSVIGNRSVEIETAAPPPTDWTLIDQEGLDELEETSASGSGGDHPDPVDQDGEHQWVAHHRSGAIHVSHSAENEELASYVAERQRTTSFVNQSGDGVTLISHAPSQLEDGPTKLVDENDKRPRVSLQGGAGSAQHEEELEEIVSTNFYPQYGVGILENSCTAFLVGPRHALTTASCVYNYSTGNWNDDLDFWRGRNGDEYLEKMLWDHAIIPAKYFILGDHIHNWALIVFAEDAASPVWLKMAYSSDVSDVAMTVYGYLPDNHPWGTMYSTVCQSDAIQEDVNCLAVQCGTSQKFSGGPILKGYNFQHSKMPLVYGISIAYDYSSTHKAVNFHPDIFWSLCHLMLKEGFDAKCGLQQK